MSSDDYRLEKRIEKIKEHSHLNEQTKKWLLNDYLTYQKRNGADAKSTQERYLRRIAKILRTEDMQLGDIKELVENKERLDKFNQELTDKIQEAHYKTQSGDLSVRNKRGYWNVWKRALETEGLDTSERQNYISNNVSFSSDKSQMTGRVKTTPEDLPTPQQVKKFLRTLERTSSSKSSLRNQALVLMLWDTGARIGEIIEDSDELQTIKMEQVSVKGDRLKIKIKGNKNRSNDSQAKDRTVEIFQGRKTLMDYISQHPKKDDPEAFLFPPTASNQHYEGEERFYTATSKQPIRRKIHQTRKEAGLDFNTDNEPFHIFRKGMITYNVVNIMSWEKVCEKLKKDPSSTMPTYLKMSMDDINATAAEGFGLDRETRENEHRMKGPPLLPKECQKCGEESKCFLENCESCGTELPDAEMPDNLETEMSEEDMRKVQELDQLKSQIDSKLEELQ